MFSIGRHMKHGKKFLGSMNMPNTLNKESWYGHKKKITEATDGVATTSKLKAADEARQAQGRDITVSSDGTWQRKGFVSKNGVVTVLTVNGKECKVIDTHMLSNQRDACAKKKKKTTDAEFQQWHAQHIRKHKCEQNHHGSAGAMEPAWTVTTFRRSEELYNLRYSGFLGDGDRQGISEKC